VTLGTSTEEIIEDYGIVFKWTGSRAYGVTFGHGEAPPPFEHGSRPYSTNHRYDQGGGLVAGEGGFIGNHLAKYLVGEVS